MSETAKEEQTVTVSPENSAIEGSVNLETSMGESLHEASFESDKPQAIFTLAVVGP